MGSFARDLQYALRQLRRSPGFAFVAILTLALGIGATAAVFSVVDAVLLRPLPFPEPDHIVAVEEEPHRQDVRRAVEPGHRQLPRPGALEEEGTPLPVAHLPHQQALV